jgi:hypothetical protein
MFFRRADKEMQDADVKSPKSYLRAGKTFCGLRESRGDGAIRSIKKASVRKLQGNRAIRSIIGIIRYYGHSQHNIRKRII